MKVRSRQLIAAVPCPLQRHFGNLSDACASVSMGNYVAKYKGMRVPYALIYGAKSNPSRILGLPLCSATYRKQTTA